MRDDGVAAAVDADPAARELLTRRRALQRVAWLLGGALAAPTVAGVLAGCGREGSAGVQGAPTAAYRLQALTAEQDRLVTAIAEHILPETDTPGARSARVNEFVDRMLATYHPAADRERVGAGLARLEARARSRHGRAFLDCAEAQQYALVDELDAWAYDDETPIAATAAPARTAAGAPTTAAAATPASVGAPAGAPPDPADVGKASFFRTLKELVLVGYYTSEAGATRELRVTPVGRYRGDVPYAQIGTAWA